MSDLSGGSSTPAESVRARARLVRARQTTLTMTGQVALVLAAAGSTTVLLGTPHAPSGSFVVQCFALGLAALAAPGARALRKFLPAISVAAAANLVLIVVLEALRSGETMIPLEVAGCAAILPILSIQISGWRRRALAVCAAGIGVVAAAALAGLHGFALLQVGIAIAFTASVALLAAQGLDAARSRNERRSAHLRRSMIRERRLMQTREDMVANLSHDLRNPLAIALGFSEMAEDQDLPADERTQALSGLRRSLWEMSQLVENVLDGSADRAGALNPAFEAVDLATLCNDALAATRVLLRQRPIVLVGAIEPGMLVLADRQRLARVLGNLLGNACKYTAAGEIRVQTSSCGRFAAIRVQDTGTGIAPEALPFIFDRFRRAHQGTVAGVGLGLAIAHRLTERMGGTLEVASEPGVGSTFTITLPLVAAERGESVAA